MFKKTSKVFLYLITMLNAVGKFVHRTADLTCVRAADIVLMLDQSTSIVVQGYDNWYVNVLGFARSVAGAFPISPDLTQVGLMKFSDDIEVVFYLNEHGDRESLLRAMQNININLGDTNIAAALRTAREVIRVAKYSALYQKRAKFGKL